MEKPGTPLINPVFQCTFDVSRRYLYIPVSNTAPKVVFQVYIGNQMVREFDVELALNSTPDWWAFYDISMFAGKEMIVQVTQGEIPVESIQWLSQAIRQGDTLPAIDNLYQERYRPQFHFTSKRGWNNDPNGLVYAAGAWHMFYQHNPFGIHWGNMHWGHAVSPDLVHWHELPEALYQHSLKDMAFSGGGLVDHKNTAGFQQGAGPAIVVAFTSTGRGECLAFSNDNGRTLHEWQGNPIIEHRGRDPKIIWYEPEQKWVLIIYEELADYDGISQDQLGYAFYASTNLKAWERLSFIPGYFECPEIFQLPLDGNANDVRWVIHGCIWNQSPSTCVIGNFNGKIFRIQEENIISHYGPQFYASQVFSNAPDQRVIMLGWLSGAEYPEMPFTQGMTVPLELSLRTTSAGIRLCYIPVHEMTTLRTKTFVESNLNTQQTNELFSSTEAELIDIELETSAAAPFTLDIRGYPIQYTPDSQEISFAGKTAVLPVDKGGLSLRVLVDRCVTEVFVNQGIAAFAAMTIFPSPQNSVQLTGEIQVQSLKVHHLSSIWKQPVL